MSGMTIKQALAVIQTEVNWHASSDTHYRAEKLEQALATLRAELVGLREELDVTIEQRDLLSQEVLRLEKDAGRYRWLRKGHHDDIAVVRGLLGAVDYGLNAVAYTYSEEIDGDDLDALIDWERGEESAND